MKRYLKALSICVLLTLSLTVTRSRGASTYYIAPASWDINTCGLTAGSSAGTGAVGSPWDLYTGLHSKSATLGPGDTVWIRGCQPGSGTATYFFNAGVYLPLSSLSVSTSELISVQMNGSVGSPIRVLNYPQESVNIDFNLTPTTSGVNTGLADAPYPDRNIQQLHFSTGSSYITFGTSADSDGNANPKGILQVYNSEVDNRTLTLPLARLHFGGAPYTVQPGLNESNRIDHRANCVDVRATGITLQNIWWHDCGQGPGTWAAGTNVSVSGATFAHGWDANNTGTKSSPNGFPSYISATYGASGTNTLKAYWPLGTISGVATGGDTSGNAHTITTIGSGITAGGTTPALGWNNPTVTASTASGTLPSGTYYTKITYYNTATTAESQPGPPRATTLASNGTLTVTAPNSYSTYDAYRVYMGTVLGSETLQGTTVGFSTSFVQSTSLAAGSALPSSSPTSIAFDGTSNGVMSVASTADFQLDKSASWTVIANTTYANSTGHQAILGKGKGTACDATQNYTFENDRTCFAGTWYTHAKIGVDLRSQLQMWSYDQPTNTLRVFVDHWPILTTTVSGSVTTNSDALTFGSPGVSAVGEYLACNRCSDFAIIKGTSITTVATGVILNNLVANGGAPTAGARLHGHGLYSQSAGAGFTKTFKDLIVSLNYGNNWNFDSSTSVPTIDNSITRVISTVGRFLLASGSGADLKNVTLDKVWTYLSPPEFIGVAGQTNTGNGVTNSVFRTASQPTIEIISLTDWNSQNNIIEGSTTGITTQFQKNTGSPPDSGFKFGTITPNTYYSSTLSQAFLVNSSTYMTLATWQAQAANYDPTSTISSSLPGTPTVSCGLNTSDAGMGLVAIANWPSSSTATISDSCLRTTFGWSSSDNIKIVSSQNLLGDVVYTGTVGTTGIAVSMLAADRPVYTPIGTDIGAITLTNTFPKFGGFLVYRTSAPGSVSLTGVSCSPSTVTGGLTNPSCTVTLSGSAPSNQVVSLSSDNAAITVPATVTVTTGNSTAAFTATSVAVATNRSAIITATLSAVNQTTTVNVNAPSVTTSSCSPASVTGGSSSTCTFGLNVAAPSGGIVITTSESSAYVTLSASSCTVLISTTTCAVTANTTLPPSQQIVPILGSFNSTSSSVNLVVNAASTAGGSQYFRVKK